MKQDQITDEGSAQQADAAELRHQLTIAEDEIANLRLQVWELRDGIIGSAAQERSVSFLLHENDRLRYLIHRPWRVAGKRVKMFTEKAQRRVDSKRAGIE